jgi:anti-sigma regulatory factor (Ser/Thr protein kinase)
MPQWDEAFMGNGHPLVLADIPFGCGELRRWARSWMAEQQVPGVEVEDVALALTELVTNSFQHGSGPVLVDLISEDHVVRLDVSDCSEGMPRKPSPSSVAVGGRGLLILEALSSNWGVRARPQGGKTVWCEFSSEPHSTTLDQSALCDVVQERVASTCTS